MRLKLFALLGALVAAQTAPAAEYPERTVEITVPFAAGGTPDVLARALAESMSSTLKQPFIVLNKLGAGGAIGAAAVARAEPDGYSLLFSPVLIATVLPVVQPNAGFTAQSFEPICQGFESQMALIVRPDSPFQSVADIVKAAKERPGQLNYGHAGIGSIPQLAVLELENAAKIQVASVPYKGDIEVVSPLLGGHIDFAPITLSSIPQGAVRILAIFANNRNPALPDVPTVKEQGLDVSPTSFGGLFAPAGAPKEVKEKLEAACKAATASPRYLETAKKALLGQQLFADSSTFSAKLAKDLEDKKRVLATLGKSN